MKNGRLDRMWKIYGKSMQKNCQSVSVRPEVASVAIVALVLLKVEKFREKGRKVSKNHGQQTHVGKKCNYCTYGT